MTQILELLGAFSLAYTGWRGLQHVLDPLASYRRIHRWSGARIAAREMYEERMLMTGEPCGEGR
jgi:hypothetical protein